MPVISSYALQYSGITFSSISSSTFDLFITEGAPLAPGGGFPGITDAQVAQLRGQGRTVVGYVNVAVTDDARYYWNPSWTSNGHDTGTPIQGQAPSWLDQAVPINFAGGDPNQDALIVEYWDPAWQQIVIDQAVALVQRGYSGVFLDDVGRYYDAGIGSGNVALMADRMIDLIHAVRAAITAVNPNAVVVTNTNPYIVTDNSGGAFGARSTTYRADVDLHLVENQSSTALDHFATYFGGEPLLILQSVTPPPLTYDQAWSRGILYTAPNTGYNSLGTFAYPATAGADTLIGGDGPNQISGLAGNDVIDGGAGQDQLYGGADNDFIDGGVGADYMSGGAGNDAFVVDQQGDQIVESAGGGTDIVYARVNYMLSAGAAVEILSAVDQSATTGLQLIGNGLDQTIYGNNGANYIEGGGGTDVLIGLGGNDTYVVDSAGDYVAESVGGGSDVVYAQTSYALAAGQEIEVLSTASQSSTAAINLTGNNLANQLYGNAGANVLNGGAGADYMLGFGGADTFQFTTALGGGNVDQLGDFFHADDTIALDHGVFTGLGVGSLPTSAFVAGSAAGDGDDRIIYNSATGQILYDADGSGSGAAAILFATVQPGTTLDASDFTVI